MKIPYFRFKLAGNVLKYLKRRRAKFYYFYFKRVTRLREY